MKDKEYKEIENQILLNDDMEAKTKLYKSMKKTSIIGLSILSVCLFISFFLISKVSLLSMVSPVFFYLLIIVGILYRIATLLFSTVFKNVLHKSSLLIYYKIYDLLAFIISIASIFLFVVMFVMTPTTVVGNSMNDTLASGDRVLVWHMGYSPKRDDVVVLHVSEKYGEEDSLYIKRVVAEEGDTVSYDEETNEFKVNGNVCESSMQAMSYYKYIKMINTYASTENTSLTFKIPKGYSIVLGDHRTNSTDSRIIGLINNDDILGKAFYTFLPFSNIGSIDEKLSYK